MGSPWLAECEKSVTGGLSKPSDLAEVKALNDKVGTYDKTCLNYIKVLEAAEAASKKMTTHAEADAEVAALKERYQKVKKVSEETPQTPSLPSGISPSVQRPQHRPRHELSSSLRRPQRPQEL